MSTQSPIDSSSWLFSFGVSGANVRNVGSKGKTVFSFPQDAASVVTAFTGQPDRITGQMPLSRLAKKFKHWFAKSDPDGAISFWTSEFNNVVCEIESIKRRKGQYIITTDDIDRPLTRGLPSGMIVPDEISRMNVMLYDEIIPGLTSVDFGS